MRTVFCFNSCDSVIKIWSVRDQCVIADVTLDNTLSCACFLNSTGDLVFGFLNNLYSISLNSCKFTEKEIIHDVYSKKLYVSLLSSMMNCCILFLVLPDLEEYGVSTYAESITAESDVYEDPAVTSEGVLPNLEPLDLSNYLVSVCLCL